MATRSLNGSMASIGPAARRTSVRTATAIVVTFGLAAIAAGLGAQQAGFKRTILQQSKLSVPGRESVTAMAEFQPGANRWAAHASGRGNRLHPGRRDSARAGRQARRDPGRRQDVFHSGRHGPQRHEQDLVAGPGAGELHRRTGQGARHAGCVEIAAPNACTAPVLCLRKPSSHGTGAWYASPASAVITTPPRGPAGTARGPRSNRRYGKAPALTATAPGAAET